MQQCRHSMNAYGSDQNDKSQLVARQLLYMFPRMLLVPENILQHDELLEICVCTCVYVFFYICVYVLCICMRVSLCGVSICVQYIYARA